MNMTFVGYEVDDSGVIFNFVAVGDGIGASDYFVRLTDAELAAISTPAQLRDTLLVKLRRKVNREGIASKLDSFIGQVLTI